MTHLCVVFLWIENVEQHEHKGNTNKMKVVFFFTFRKKPIENT